MAKDDSEKDEGKVEESKLEKAIKTNRTMLVSLLVCAVVTISILLTCVLVINLQLANRREVPAEEFAELLAGLDIQLKHLDAIHNSEAQVYFEFQDSLADIKSLYQHQDINELRQLLADREKDTRKLLDLMLEGAGNLANMSSGSRDWVNAFGQQVNAAKQQSQQRQQALLDAMKVEDDPLPEEN